MRYKGRVLISEWNDAWCSRTQTLCTAKTINKFFIILNSSLLCDGYGYCYVIIVKLILNRKTISMSCTVFMLRTVSMSCTVSMSRTVSLRYTVLKTKTAPQSTALALSNKVSIANMVPSNIVRRYRTSMRLNFISKTKSVA